MTTPTYCICEKPTPCDIRGNECGKCHRCLLPIKPKEERACDCICDGKKICVYHSECGYPVGWRGFKDMPTPQHTPEPTTEKKSAWAIPQNAPTEKKLVGIDGKFYPDPAFDSERWEAPTEKWERDKVFFSELEEVLDEYFPKVEEDGEEKRLMKRGDALMLFSEANRIHSRLLATARAESHSTEEGYCCACDYDIAGFKGSLAAARAEERAKKAEYRQSFLDGVKEERERIEKIAKEMWKEMLDKEDPDNYEAIYAITGFNDALSKVLTAINPK